VLTDVEVEVTAIGISNATAFVGLPPDNGFVSGVSLAEQNLDTATGLLIENFTMGIGIFKPIAGDFLPEFTAVKIDADTASFRIGDGDSDPTNDFLTLLAQDIDVELNLGGPIIEGASALFGNAAIDFALSFPDADPDKVGYEVATGTTTDPVLLDFRGQEIITASIARATIQVSEWPASAGPPFRYPNTSTSPVASPSRWAR
jgi:hypothetical protein